MPPTSTMTPLASVNSGVHDGSVARVTRMAPRRIEANSRGSRITTTSASTIPGLTQSPVNSAASDAGAFCSPRRRGSSDSLISNGSDMSRSTASCALRRSTIARSS